MGLIGNAGFLWALIEVSAEATGLLLQAQPPLLMGEKSLLLVEMDGMWSVVTLPVGSSFSLSVHQVSLPMLIQKQL